MDEVQTMVFALVGRLVRYSAGHHVYFVFTTN